MSKRSVERPGVRLVDSIDETLAELLPDGVTVTLDDVRTVMREGLLALSVEAGMAAAQVLMAEEADALCGAWNTRDPERQHRRGGTRSSRVTMGGQRVELRRPRVHAMDNGERGAEVPLATFGIFADGDLLTRVATERMLAGVSTRDYERASEPIGATRRSEATSTSKSAVSRRFVSGTRAQLDALLGRDLTGLDPVVLMVDGVEFAGVTMIVALVVGSDGVKTPVGLRAGGTENAGVVTALLADLVDRGLNTADGVLVVIDGAKALASAVAEVFGDQALVQRCQIHKRRNVADHLPISERDRIDERLKGIFADGDPASGKRRALRLAAELERSWPDAAGSLREGLDDMFTVASLGVEGRLGASLRCTNMIESMLATVRKTTRNVKRWQDKGDMRRRWCAAGILDAESRFRRVNGYHDLPALKTAIGRRVQAVTTPTYDENQAA